MRVGSLQEYRARGGGQAFTAATQVEPATLVELITASGLRGRGGGGFPTGRKWAGIRAAGPGRRFAVCNAAEGEPGTFKDRALLRHDPYRRARGTGHRRRTRSAPRSPTSPPSAATRAKLTGSAKRSPRSRPRGSSPICRITLVLGPDEYLFGEEKALLEVIEGNDPLPRLLPPYEHGLFATDIQLGWQAVDAPTASVRTTGAASPTRRSSTTWRRWPTCRGSCSRGRSGSGRWAPPESPGTTVATIVGDVRGADGHRARARHATVAS